MKKMNLIAPVLAVMALAVAGPSGAHHAVQAQFDVNRTVDVRGTLVRVDWINPHAYFHFDVTGANGAVTRWSFESPGPNGLRRAGLSNRNLFVIGQTYAINSHPARNGRPLGTLNRVTFPNGRTVSVVAGDPGRS